MTWQRFSTTRKGCQPFFPTPSESAESAPLSYEPADHPTPPSSDPPPPWRTFLSKEAYQQQAAADAWQRWLRLRQLADTSERYSRARTRATSFVLPDSDASRKLVLAVNAAISLRRPLLLTGLPGSGKTTLAYALADWLGLGPVLEWSVTPGATLAEALVTYDPLSRLQDLEIARKSTKQPQDPSATEAPPPPPVEYYMRLGPVGTAFLPAPLPRVLLIDEIDKGDLNLAHDLLHLFEEGKFPLTQLERDSQTPANADDDNSKRWIKSADEDENGKPIPVPILAAYVQCYEFPLVVMTSNGEREFPPAFNRRCLRVPMPDFSRDAASLEAIVRNHWEPASKVLAQLNQALEDFQEASRAAQEVGDSLALDQLLNLAFLLEQETPAVSDATRKDLREVLLQALNAEPEQTPEPGPEGV
jgi:MoxR-like ATPase